MTSPALTFGPLLALVESLNAAGVRAALDPSDVNVPGAWVTVEGIQAETLDGSLRVEAVVYLIVGDQDYLRALEDLADLHNATLTVLSPDGKVVPQGVILPSTPTPLPALRVPVYLYESE